MRQVGEAGADEGVARVVPREDAGDHQAVGEGRLHVLQRMYREVDAAFGESGLDLLREQALAADLGEGAVLDTVAGGTDRDDLRGKARMRGDQAVAHQIGLIKGHRAATGADTERGGGHGDDNASGITVRTCVTSSHTIANASDRTTIGMPARAWSVKVSGAPIRSARSAISTLVRLPDSRRLPERVESSDSA